LIGLDFFGKIDFDKHRPFCFAYLLVFCT
jgi:hypothetical protein